MKLFDRVCECIDGYIGDMSTSRKMAVEIMASMKYADGWDEDFLIAASNTYRVEAVSLVEAWNSIIEAAVYEGINNDQHD